MAGDGNDGLNFAGWMIGGLIGLAIVLPVLIILFCCMGLPLIGATDGR